MVETVILSIELKLSKHKQIYLTTGGLEQTALCPLEDHKESHHLLLLPSLSYHIKISW